MAAEMPCCFAFKIKLINLVSFLKKIYTYELKYENRNLQKNFEVC